MMPLAIAATLLALQILLVFVHLAAYGTLDAAFGIGSPALSVVFFCLAFTFVAASFLAHLFRGKWIDWIYTAAAYWFGLVNFLFVGGAAFLAAEAGFYAGGVYVAPQLLGGIAFGAAFLVHLYGTWNSGRAEMTEVRVKIPDTPASWKGKSIVFVSDLHLGSVWKKKFAAKVVRKIAALSPEAVFVGGDLYDGNACDIHAIIEPFHPLRAPYGIFFITGNHEYYLPKQDIPEAFAAIRKAGMRILENEAVELDGLVVAGIDYNATSREEDLKKVLAAMPSPPGVRILLKHEPNHLETVRAAGFSLVLAGHTHRGQIFPLTFMTRALYKGFDYGLKKFGDMTVFTSSGAGTWGPPLRLGTKSEIVHVTFA